MADSTSEEWKTFLKAVDSLSAANEDVETAAVFLTSLKPIRTADHLEGQDASDLLAGSGAPHNFGPKGLLRRAVRAADAAGAAKRRRTATPPDAGSASAAQNPGGSAQTLAQAIAPTGPKVNVQEQLKKYGLETILGSCWRRSRCGRNSRPTRTRQQQPTR